MNKCPLSGQEITDPIVVTFENRTKATYQASAFLDAFMGATTRKPSDFTHNVGDIECHNPSHRSAIDAILSLPYASLRQVMRNTSPLRAAQGLNFEDADSTPPDSPGSNHSRGSLYNK